jgi:hypothetical protein
MRTNRGPGLIEPVKLQEDVAAGNVDRKAVSLPAGALFSQPHSIVDDLQRLRELPAHESIQGECGRGNTHGHVIAGRHGRRPGFPGGGCGTVEVSH